MGKAITFSNQCCRRASSGSSTRDRSTSITAQQTLAHYEVARARIAADLLPRLAERLDLSLDELLVGEVLARTPGKRGPASRLERQIEAVAQLPKSEQKFVAKMLDNLLAQHGQENANAA